MKKHFYIIPALCAALSLPAVFSCKNSEQQEQVTQVETYTLKDTACVVKFTYPATLCGIQDVAIYPQVSGRITAIKVTEGQFVNKNDVLFEIDDVPYKAAYDQALAAVDVAKAQLETAQLTYQSKKNLFDRDIISDYQLKLSENSVKTAEAVLGQAYAELRNAQNNLSFTKVRTMGKGQIGQLPLKVGSLVGPNLKEPMTYVSDNSSVYADFSVPENVQLALGLNPRNMEHGEAANNLRLITNLGEEYPHTGKIHSLSGLISAQTGSLPIRSIFPNPDGILLSGGACKVVFSSEMDDEILIPRSAIKEVQNMTFVYVVRDSCVLEQVPIQAERYNSKLWMLLPDEDGSYPLQEGDMITRTTNRLHNGDKVQIVASEQ